MSDRVQKRNPPTYTGKGDPIDLIYWIQEMDKVFLTVGCPEEFQARIAVYYLKEQANIFWQGIKDNFLLPVQVRNEDGELETFERDWDELKEVLKKEFFPEHQRRAKKDEFVNFKQTDNMSVKDFYNRFNELGLFAPELIPTEELKARAFEERLSWKIKSRFSGETFTDLQTVYERAFNIETQNSQMARELGYKRKDIWESPFDRNNKRGNHGNNFREKNKTFNGSGNSGGRNRNFGDSKYTKCIKCGEDRHPGKKCDGSIVDCFHCGELGHRANECPSKAAGKPPIPPKQNLGNGFNNKSQSGYKPATAAGSNFQSGAPSQNKSVTKPAGTVNSALKTKIAGTLYKMPDEDFGTNDM